MSQAPLMLTVSGLRGIVGESLTAEVISRHVTACSEFLQAASPGKPARIVIGRDGRANGAELAPLVVEAWREVGFDVIDLGMSATPTTAFMVVELQALGGMELTASHNPAQWNGLKLFTAEGRAPFAHEATTIIDRYHAGSPTREVARRGGLERCEDAAERHVRRVTGLIDAEAVRARGFRVVLDSVNASGGRAAKRLLGELGCEVVELHCDDSGEFPHTPEPVEENLRGLCAAVRRERADLGFAQDPDADRLAIVDNTGRYIGEEYTLVLACQQLLAMAGDGGHALVANLSTSRMLDDVAKKWGGVAVHRSAVGEANVVATMGDVGALAGGEGNGGVVWPEVALVRDSIGGMALVLCLLASRERTLEELVEKIPSYAILKEKLPIRAGLAEAAETALAEAFAGERIDRQDGIRIDQEDRWVHVRSSNTEPILRLIAEAPTEPAAAELLRQVRALVDSL